MVLYPSIAGDFEMRRVDLAELVYPFLQQCSRVQGQRDLKVDSWNVGDHRVALAARRHETRAGSRFCTSEIKSSAARAPLHFQSSFSSTLDIYLETG